jgi:LmbE family N-acetylglucosaminyl deacetylase
MRRFLCLAAAFAPAPAPGAEPYAGLDVMKAHVLFVGAHPDDDSGVVATLARYGLDEGYRTAVVTVTGGEGGGNATGRESGRALGLIRRTEELNALALAGVSATNFLGLQDFYFTLSAEETERVWGSDFVCDVARIVRLRRPEVIVTMWPGPGTHGQHQMAARAATLAFARAGEPDYCPEQVASEGLAPFAPDRLYYGGRGEGDSILEVPTADYSPAARMSYAELKALSVMQYRSQGYDRRVRIPVGEPRPERFLLVGSRVPRATPDAHMLTGSLLPAAASPPGVRLEILTPYQLPVGVETPVTVRITNGTGGALRDVSVDLAAPAGLAVRGKQGATRGDLAAGERAVAAFHVRPGPGAVLDRNAAITAAYSAVIDGRAASGHNRAMVRPISALAVAFRPGFDVAGYREFARSSGTEWVIETLPARVPLVVGRANDVVLDLVNAGDREAAGALELDLPEGLRLLAPVSFSVPAGGEQSVTARVEAAPGALPDGRGSARLDLEARAAGSRDAAEAFLLPAVDIPRVERAPEIDGDLGDLAALAHVEIRPGDRWWREPPEDALDLSGEAWLGYDDGALYVGVRVRDQTVVCNIAPDDVRAQLRSDAVGITVDPSGSSEDTGTTLQAAAFPCTTAGWGARAFRDADARQGPAEETAPGLRIASRRTEAGFDVEWALPWAAMPETPGPGSEIGLNLVLYDGDDADAAVGANVSQTGLAWAAFELGGKQALPYLWGRGRLAD